MPDQRKQCILERCFICWAYEVNFQSFKYCYQISSFSTMEQLQLKKANKRVFVNKELKVVQDLFVNIVNIFHSTNNLSYLYLHYTSIITAISKTLKKLSIGKTFFKRFLNPNIPSLFFNISV